ncbi:IFI6-like protein [Mya arenaria]|uniref:IFI6-like protein n=1 Tax=Mya arenaria TaxID=6604 RepID=A0ABY7EWE6_MYAAR|nr:IFI6-like protein [Mya arenaria]
MQGVKMFLLCFMAMSMIGFSGSLAPDDVCADVQKIEDAFKRSDCEPIGYIKTITNDSCTTVNELLHCVAESIYGYREREHREACVLHMRTAIQDRHIDSICIFWCLGGPAAVGFTGVLALIALVTFGLPALGFGAAGIMANSIAASLMAWWGGAVPAGGIIATMQSVAVLGIGYQAILATLFSAAAISRAAMNCNCCEK